MAAIATIDDTEWRVGQLAQPKRIELRDDAARVGVIAKLPDSLEDLGDEALANLRCLLVAVVADDLLEVPERRAGEGDSQATRPLPRRVAGVLQPG